MTVGIWCSKMLEILSKLAETALFPPMLCLLGITALGCAVGTVFYLTGSR